MQFSGEERVVSGTPGAGLNPWRNERFIDVGNYWLENILWPIYKRTMKDKYQHMSNRLNQSMFSQYDYCIIRGWNLVYIR
jgi:L,D-peptidoglycan transpeptidase YkuD (ErfK/YbiS/YcfS/YnhG family)